MYVVQKGVEVVVARAAFAAGNYVILLKLVRSPFVISLRNDIPSFHPQQEPNFLLDSPVAVVAAAEKGNRSFSWLRQVVEAETSRPVCRAHGILTAEILATIVSASRRISQVVASA